MKLLPRFTSYGVSEIKFPIPDFIKPNSVVNIGCYSVSIQTF